MQALLDKITLYIFSKAPIIKYLDGYKRQIGNGLLLLAGIVSLLKLYFPEIPHLAQVDAGVIAAIALFSRLFGDIHADAKFRLL